MSQSRQEREWHEWVARQEAKGLCPFSGYTFARCARTVCDCFRDMYPDDPYGLHPEAFVIGRPTQEPT